MKFEIDIAPKWYQHEPEVVAENEKCKILCDIYTQGPRNDILSGGGLTGAIA